MMAPVILWIDEIEKGFASAASQSVDGGLSKRMFGTLLTWMQEHHAPVFLIATANDIEALPPELLRKGRFDEIFFIDLPNLEARAQIFSVHLQKRKRELRKFDIPALSLPPKDTAARNRAGDHLRPAILFRQRRADHGADHARPRVLASSPSHARKNRRPAHGPRPLPAGRLIALNSLPEVVSPETPFPAHNFSMPTLSV